MDDDLRAKIDAAVAAGKSKRIPTGQRALKEPVHESKRPRVAAETCGKGRLVDRHGHLDELDKDRF